MSIRLMVLLPEEAIQELLHTGRTQYRIRIYPQPNETICPDGSVARHYELSQELVVESDESKSVWKFTEKWPSPSDGPRLCATRECGHRVGERFFVKRGSNPDPNPLFEAQVKDIRAELSEDDFWEFVVDLEIVKWWAWCPFCGVRTDQVQIQGVYICLACLKRFRPGFAYEEVNDETTR